MNKKTWTLISFLWLILPFLGLLLYEFSPMFSHIFYDFIGTGIVTFVAAWAGGWAAFKAERTTREDKERESIKRRNVVNGNSSIFTLMRMYNKLLGIQRQLIDPTRDNSARFIYMVSTILQEKDDIKLNVENLYFLLETDDRNLLGEIIVEEERYKSAIDALNERSRIHRYEVQPLLEQGRFQFGGNYTFAQFEEILGPRIFATIQLATEQTITHIDNAVVSIKSCADKLTAFLKKQYPNEIIISF